MVMGLGLQPVVMREIIFPAPITKKIDMYAPS